MAPEARALDPVSRKPQAGFTLIEVLAAIVVAGMMVAVLSRAFSTAWSAARAPAEIAGATILAQSLIAGVRAVPGAVPVRGTARQGSFDYAIGTEIVDFEPRPSPAPSIPLDAGPTTRTAPAPGAGNGGGGETLGTGAAAGTRPGEPGSRGQQTGRADSGPPIPLRVTVVVKAPSGRSIRLETVKLVPGAR
ncbi:type II secretion system protein [Prosthecodimorpha staleyi]|uniref:Prepilin-type N-terminal cleavage/methylation domain-containing protein n=1 Tax=Prosthecodimorpha staleyi TaxID=2840188 RepID=A0A947GEQ2_9HYPH|nr:prepilin-type N-terminal cleavage/methylation domain-containing protein [Prosthecodimorpha staleyi]MBT9289625.1 prepilin-type N-terminal cleavage/methylation domain-containing protein [Prosthecodimorpha staleyi]